MADYSHFPFDEFSVDEIAQMMLQSVLLGDDEFAIACREQIKRRPTTHAVDAAPAVCTCEPPDGYPHLPSCPLYGTPRR